MAIRRDQDLIPARKLGPGRADWIKGALIGLIVAFLARLLVHNFVFFPLAIQSTDMEPTLARGSSPYFLRIFDSAELERGTVVLLTHPEDPESYMIRRIAALPGEQVQIFERQLFVNNQPVETAWERELSAASVYPGEPVRRGSSRRDFAGPFIVPEGQVFVLADNRVRALDSRQLGPVARSQIQAILWE